MNDDALTFDVVIVGAGPAGLSAAIRLQQLAKAQQQTLSICVVEKGATVGAHLLSGAVLEPRALDELLPDWQARNAPLTTPVTSDKFYYLNATKAWRLPTPAPMHNRGNYIISLDHFAVWLAEQAELMGIEIFPGFAAADVIYDEQDCVNGIMTGAMGIAKDGQTKPNYQPSMAIHAAVTLFAEGCRGHLGKQLMQKYQLRATCQPQTYALGIKELWRVDASQHQPGSVVHTIGWPLDRATYGGSFIYHLANEQHVAVGFVVGLDYQNPYLEPFAEMQRFKTHPTFKALWHDGERLAYGARALNEGGWQAMPQLVFPGGALIGCEAGFLNVPKIKGIHTAMKSGMLAADAAFAALQQKKAKIPLTAYPQAVDNSWLGQELRRVRNIRPAFRYGLWAGLAWSAFDTYVLHGRGPWTFNHHADHLSLQTAKPSLKIDYPKPDGKITFDKLSSVYLSNTHHEEDQPCHLQLQDPNLAIDVNWAHYASPETRYCPAGVYEILQQEGKAPQLQINAQNCIHCKTCDIKDPRQNITWVAPEGGGGPHYTDL